ncbi:glycoprotein 3-alpha-L-fucosyltransferase A-like isoform X2 [Artemia franciscana]|uniref:Fucosyltransferase n=1 Tax=Artemia franciscana TaxID=6661 RepID=A0AA88IA24_ARTSF|nr:hypothetical protein QYM36_006733 [Artemia franciscana]
MLKLIIIVSALFFAVVSFISVKYTRNSKSNFYILIYSRKYDNLKFENEKNEDLQMGDCHFTEGGAEKVRYADVVVIEDLFYIPKRHSLDQIFVFRSLESPLHTNFARLSNKEAINWTSTYRLDSDIPTPYGFFDSSRLEPSTSLPDIKGKEFKAAWFVSNCDASNQRLEFVRQLQNFMAVDILGKCGNSSICPKNTSDSKDCIRRLSHPYSFYLAFENSHCKEYITEKFFDVGLGFDWIPVVLGPSIEDYQRLSPPESFIFVNASTSPKRLAEDLLSVFKNRSRFLEHFQWRRQGRLKKYSFFNLLCEKLMNGSDGKNYYKNINEWWHGTTECHAKPGGNVCKATGICDVKEEKYQYVPS